MYSSLFDRYKHFTDHYTEKAIDELDSRQHAPFRVYRDVSTSVFNSIFFQRDIDRYRFVDYVFHKINIDLLQINNQLKEYEYKPLNSREDIKFYYKGGNVFHEYFYESIYPNIPNPKFKEDLSKNFKTSDNDFSIKITTDRYQRYLQIYQAVLKILSSSLSELAFIFDGLLNGTITSNTDNPIIDKTPSVTIQQYEILNKILKKIRKAYDRDDYDKLDIIRREVNSIKNLQSVDLIVLSIHYQVMEAWSIYSREPMHKRTMNEMERILQNKRNIFVSNVFYTKERVDKMLNDILSELSELTKPFYDGDDEYLYKPTEDTFVELYQAPNSMIYNRNNPDELVRIVSRKYGYHQITFNDTIHNMFDNGLNDIHFSLMRIKLALRVKNGIYVNDIPQTLSISSELIDVSITKYENKYVPPVKLVQFGNYMSLYAYDIDGMTHDVIRTVFELKIFVNLDLKYEKRIIRIMAFLYLSCKNNNFMDPYDKVIQISRSIHANITDNKPFDKNLLEPLLLIPCDVIPALITNNINLDLLTLKSQYWLIQPIVTYLIVNYVWLSKPRHIWLKLMNKYRHLYSYVPITNENANDYYAKIKSMLADMTRTLAYVGDNIKKDVMLGGNERIKQIKFFDCPKLSKKKPIVWSIEDALNVS